MSNNTPFIVDKNLGVNMTVEPEDLTQTRMEKPSSRRRKKKKYLFDSRGCFSFSWRFLTDDITRHARICATGQTQPRIATPF